MVKPNLKASPAWELIANETRSRRSLRQGEGVLEGGGGEGTRKCVPVCRGGRGCRILLGSPERLKDCK